MTEREPGRHWEGSGIAKLLGWKQTAEESGAIRGQFECREEFYNPTGTVAGGYLTAMLDIVTTSAVSSSLGPDDHARATLEIKVSFIRPAGAGTLAAEGRVIHRGRSVAFAEGTLSSDDGAIVATATMTMRISAKDQ